MMTDSTIRVAVGHLKAHTEDFKSYFWSQHQVALASTIKHN
jgi:hypothetical protein